MAHGRITLTGFSLTPPDLTPPNAPTGLTATPSDSTVALTWTAATDNIAVTAYRVYQGGVLVKSVATTSTSITGLTNFTTYTFTVTAVDAAGNESAPSGPVTATPTVTYSADTFTRANSASVGSTEVGGFPWTANPSTDQGLWAISSNTLQKPNPNSLTTPKELLINDGHADGTLECTFVSSTAGASGIAFRVSTDLSAGFLFSRSSATPGVYTLKRRAGTTYTTLWTQAPGTGATGDVAKVVLNGSSIKCYVNGALVFSTTDTINQTATLHGVWGGAIAVTSFDGWSHTGATS